VIRYWVAMSYASELQGARDDVEKSTGLKTRHYILKLVHSRQFTVDIFGKASVRERTRRQKRETRNEKSGFLGSARNDILFREVSSEWREKQVPRLRSG
jgi:hypothetical protein